MKKKIIITLAIIAALAAGTVALHSYIVGELYAWYDAGYDDALDDLGITIINGEIIRDN